MAKPHTGNHGLHKYRRSEYFKDGGVWFALIAIVIIFLWFIFTIWLLGG